MEILKQHVRDIPDFPQPGILFKDITPILKSPVAFRAAVQGLCDLHQGGGIDLICGIESRGFLFGATMGYELGIGFVPVRKPGKLPASIIREAYALEYGTNVLEMHTDAVQAGQRVLIIDDLLATGGTAMAAGNLVRALGGMVVGYTFVIELSFLSGRARLNDAPVNALLTY